MTSLSANNLPENIRSYSYDRDAVEIGIVHFGVGNFHRAHQAVYVEDLLEAGETQWGIAGVSLRSDAMQKALAPQDYIYTLAILEEQTEYRVIGALKDILVAPNNPQAVIDLVAKPTTQLISSTITEKGYYLSSGRLNLEHPVLLSEMSSLKNPVTIYGYLARGLIKRCQNAPTTKLTIMCCDNISSGGELLAEGVQHLLRQHSKETLEWSHKNVSFISSMVDRVSPATDAKLREAVLRDTNRNDASPVSAERYSQWIIEDNFAGARPAFDQVGAVFSDDIAPFERMKLRYLNAAHTIASSLGYLYKDVYVHETLMRADVFRFMRQALYKNVLPNAMVPEGYSGETYIEEVIKRFQNANLPYANLQVGTDSSQKIQQRWFPTIDAAMEQGADCSYFEFCLAAWVIFIQTALRNGVLNDPMKSEFEQFDATHRDAKDLDEVVRGYLKIANADKYGFYRNDKFMRALIEHAHDIKSKGVEGALRLFLEEAVN